LDAPPLVDSLAVAVEVFTRAAAFFTALVSL
jgi:hypothetical protein